jgi:choline oxidase
MLARLRKSDRIVDRFDFVVIGGGTVGALIASRLAQDGRFSVAAVEANPPERGRHGNHHEGEPQAKPSPRANHPQVQPDRRARLKKSAAFRPPDEQLDNWADLGATGWNASEMRPYFDTLFAEAGVHTTLTQGEHSDAFIRAAQRLGFVEVDFTSGVRSRSVGPVPRAFSDYKTRSSTMARIDPEADLPTSVRVFADTWVRRLVFDSAPRIVAVDTSIGLIEVAREAILCCGPHTTPKLLMLSGIGPHRILQSFGLDVVSDLPGVGQNLMDHAQVKIQWEVERSISSDPQHCDVALFEDTATSHLAPDVMLHLSSDPNSQPDHGPVFRLTVGVGIPWNRGTIGLQSLNPRALPCVEARYLADPRGHDEQLLLKGIRIARHISETAPLKSRISAELIPSLDACSATHLVDFTRRTSRTAHHAAGTARMGDTHDRDCVVDPELRVIGVDGVRVADGSVMPSIPAVDTTMTCMVIGERCAEFIKRTSASGSRDPRHLREPNHG